MPLLAPLYMWQYSRAFAEMRKGMDSVPRPGVDISKSLRMVVTATCVTLSIQWKDRPVWCQFNVTGQRQ